VPPVIRAVGAVAGDVAAISPGLPAGTQVGDGLIMICETFAQPITASGWTVEFELDQTTLTRITVLSRIATGTDPTTTSDSGQHQIGRIIGIEAGTFDPADFIHAISAGNTQTSTASVSISGVSTTVDDCLIIAASVSDLPDAVSTTEYSSPANSNLSNVTLRINDATNAGNGGSVVAISGEQATQGATGATTVTAANAGVRASVTLAIPPVPSGGTTVTPATVALTSAYPAPAVLAASIVTPDVVGLAGAYPAAAILAASKVTPAMIFMRHEFHTVALHAAAVVTPATVALVVGHPTPAVVTAPTVLPAAVALTSTHPTPTIDVGPPVVTPATIALSITHITPRIGTIEEWIARPATRWLAPTTQGTGDGLSSANAAAITTLESAITAVGPGGVIELRSDLGPYVTISNYAQINTGGTPGQPVVIRGPRPGDGAKAVIQGDRTDPWVFGAGNVGDEIWQLGVGADHQIWAYLTLENALMGWQIMDDLDGLVFTEMTTDNCQRLLDTNVADPATASVHNMVVSNIVSMRCTKGFARLQFDSHHVEFRNIVADGLGVDGDAFFMGIQCVDTVHDIKFFNVIMRNGYDSNGVNYWNADGFVGEADTHHLTFYDCIASGMTDGGWDLKSDHVYMERCFAHDNKRNYRFWGADTVLVNCVGSHPNHRSGSGTQAQVHPADQARVTLRNCMFVDWSPDTIVFDADGFAILTVESATVIRHTSSTLVTEETNADVIQVAVSDTTRSALLPTAEAWWSARKYLQTGNWLDRNNGHDLVAISDPAFTYDGSDSFWTLDGDDGFSVADDPALDFDAAGEFTLVARVRLPAHHAASAFIAGKKGGFGAGTAGYVLFVTSASQHRLLISDGTTQPGDTDATLALNTWAILVARRNATEVQSFTNGASVAPSTDTTTGSLENAVAFTVGTAGSGGSFFTGDVSDVALWRTALTNAEILSLVYELLAAAQISAFPATPNALSVGLPTPTIVVAATAVTPATVALAAAFPPPAPLAAVVVNPLRLELAVTYPSATLAAGAVTSPTPVALVVGLLVPLLPTGTDTVALPAAIAIRLDMPIQTVWRPPPTAPAGPSINRRDGRTMVRSSVGTTVHRT
jgi:hypothetical protein